MNHNVNNNNKLEYEFQGKGLTVSEKRWATNRFQEYRSHYHIESLSDLSLLEELVFREALQERYKKKIGKLAKDKKKKKDKDGKSKTETSSELVPTYILKALDENLERILTLKEKLGLFEEKKEEDAFKKFEILGKKFDIWEKDHIEERGVTCPFCSMKFFLHMRTDKYQESKLKLYKNKVLCNEHLWKCYKEGKITKEDMAKILNVSPNYIDFLEEKIYKPSK